MSTIDLLVICTYALAIMGLGWFVALRSKKIDQTASDFFLANKSLPWWAIGASLIAANISAEQFIGMSGSGFSVGLAIASYEWMAAITLLLVGKFFLPLYLKLEISTIPEFIEKRYSSQLKSILAVFWVFLYVFVNIASVLYLGALSIQGLFDLPLIYGILLLALFSGAYSIYGGLASVAWTDVVQVVFLIVGGFLTTFLALDLVSQGQGAWNGLALLYEAVPQKFEMILEPSNPQYINLPGIAVLVGGMWVANLYYWGFNQYIIQRTLAAKSLKEAQNGILFAAGIKLLLPLLVVIPGIAAFVIVQDPEILASLGSKALEYAPNAQNPDRAYPWLLNLLPPGMKGLAFAALCAAIVSSLASMVNSTSTILTLDVFAPFSKVRPNDKRLIRFGRISGIFALGLGVLTAPLLGNIEQAFQFIQEYTGLVSPGILAIFVLGLFTRFTTNKAAIFGIIFSTALALYFKVGANGWITSSLFPSLPFMHQMGITFVCTCLFIAGFSLLQNQGRPDSKGFHIQAIDFKTGWAFNFVASILVLLIGFLYWFLRD